MPPHKCTFLSYDEKTNHLLEWCSAPKRHHEVTTFNKQSMHNTRPTCYKFDNGYLCTTNPHHHINKMKNFWQGSTQDTRTNTFEDSYGWNPPMRHPREGIPGIAFPN